MLLSAGWIVVVTLTMQNLAGNQGGRSIAELSKRTSAILNRAAARERTPLQMDPRLGGMVPAADLSVIPDRKDGIVVIAPGGLDALRTAEFVDRAVRKLGIRQVAISPDLISRQGFDVVLELLRRGYHDDDLDQLIAGNVDRVLADETR